MEKYPDIVVSSTDSLAAMLEAYIDEDVDMNKKYCLVMYLWNEEYVEMEEGYVISDAILPTEEHFSEFMECVMSELKRMVGRKLEVIYIPDFIQVKKLAELLGVSCGKILAQLFVDGKVAKAETLISSETVEKISSGYDVIFKRME